MRKPSIKTRIQIAIMVFITVALSLGSIVLHLKMKQVFEDHTKNDLKSIAILVAREIEVVDGKVVYDWYEDIQHDPISREKDFIQSWELHGPRTQRSPILGDSDLPKFYGKLGEFVYRDVLISKNGKPHHAKAVGLLVTPNTSELNAEQLSQLKRPLKPHVLVIATDTEHYEQFLKQLEWATIFTIIVISVFSFLIIHFILKVALQPIHELSSEITEKHENALDSGFLIQPQFPSELRELVTQYNKLLTRVGHVLTREKNFSSYVAHELRTPLTGISTTLELALNKPRDAAYYQNKISEALKVTGAMQSLIERLMVLSQLQNNAIQPESEPINLLSIAQQSWENQSDKAAQRNLSIAWPSQDHAKDLTVSSDRQLVTILIQNLLTNAVSYAEEHSTISVSQSSENEMISLTISNAVRNLSDSDIDHFFDPFYRKDKNRPLEENNFGIGLSICQEIAKNLHGKLCIKLDNNEVFSVRFQLSQKN